MRSRPTSRPLRWFLAAIILLFVGSAVVSLATVAFQGTRNADAAADEILDRISLRTTDLIDAQLRPATVSLQQIALAMENLPDSTSESREHMLATQLATMSNLSGAFIALPDGSFHFVRRGESELILKRIAIVDGVRTVVEGPLNEELLPNELQPIDDSFDPRIRPWYTAAVANAGGPAWTQPYVFFASQEPGVTTARAIVDASGQVQAVVGLDVTLTSLNSAVDNLPIDATADAFLVADGKVLAAPSGRTVVTNASGEMTLVTPDALGLDGSDSGRIATAELDREGLPDWSVVVRADQIEFVDAVKRQSRNALLAVGLTVIVSLALLWVVGQRIRRPIDELATLVDRDPLTELPNRRALLAFGAAALEVAAADDSDVAVAILDIDYFKSVNDVHGHAVGDETLRRLGEAFRSVVRPDDIVGRWGGDEFVVVLIGTDRGAARTVLERIVDAGNQELQARSETAACSLTMGLATRNGRDVDVTSLIAEADERLLAAKRSRDADGQTMAHT